MENIIDRIKAALTSVPDAEFSKAIDQLKKTLVNVNSSNPYKARTNLSTPEFAKAIQAKVTQLRKTIATGFMVLVEDPAYGKPVYIRIRKGGVLARGIGNETGLVATIESAIQEGVNVVTFKDSSGGSFTIRDIQSVRQVGNEPGSRTGNRGDVEIMDAKGKAHRISVKKENANGVAGLIRFFAKRRPKIQKNLKAFLQANPTIELHPQGYLSVPIMNEGMFKYCWFGNDIDAGGGVVVGNFEGASSFTLNEAGDEMIVKCLRAFSPNDNVKELMQDAMTGIDLLMKVNLRSLHLDIIGARVKRMAGRYELPGFDIEEVTSECSLASYAGVA